MLPVAPVDELPLVWSRILPVWLVPVVLPIWPDWPVAEVPVVLVCAWTAVAPNMAAATEALSIPLSSVFIFMVFSSCN